MHLLKSLKIGFLGAGNLAQAIMKSLVDSNTISAEMIYVSNRTPGKLKKVQEQLKVNICSSNEELIETADIVFLATKPQDIEAALEPVSMSFLANHLIISLAAGVTIKSLQKIIHEGRIVRVMPNTPSMIGCGVVGYCMEEGLGPAESVIVEDLLKPLGLIVALKEDETFDALTVACSAGTGFVFEFMSYWQDWLEEHGIAPEMAKRMTIDTFIGAGQLAINQHQQSFEDLLSRVASKKGVTAAGLESLREEQVERLLRIAFEKASLRNKELDQK